MSVKPKVLGNKRNRYIKKNGGKVNAVECERCVVNVDGVHISVLGAVNLKIIASKSEVRIVSR